MTIPDVADPILPAFTLLREHGYNLVEVPRRTANNRPRDANGLADFEILAGHLAASVGGGPSLPMREMYGCREAGPRCSHALEQPTEAPTLASEKTGVLTLRNPISVWMSRVSA